MVHVKVRETYDLHTTKDKMTVIAIHTPKPDILKRSYPGLLMQCKMYRPFSCDVALACASVMPLDPKGVGTSPGDVAPEDVFNPILYKAMSNKGMSQLEARINAINMTGSGLDVNGDSAAVEVDSFTSVTDEFPVYYGLLSNTHEWRHANVQSGLEMRGLKPLVYEMVYNVGDQYDAVYDSSQPAAFSYPKADADYAHMGMSKIIGGSKPMPFINCTSYTYQANTKSGSSWSGFDTTSPIPNMEQDVPYLNCVVGAIIVPPSRLHELFFRMTVVWDVEFSTIRPVQEISDWTGIARIGATTHYQNYSYSATKEALTGDPQTMLSNDSCMVSSNAEVTKVM